MAETIEKKSAAKPAAKIAAKKPAADKPAVIKKPAAKPAVPASASAPASAAAKEPAGKKTEKYYEAVGRRKTATARVRLYTKGDKEFMVNGHPFGLYFKGAEFKNVVESPLVKMNCTERFRVTAVVKGGGVNAQAEALRHGITRALVMFNADFKKRLKKSGYLTRDPRMKERKKPGLKKARRAPQWAKR